MCVCNLCMLIDSGVNKIHNCEKLCHLIDAFVVVVLELRINLHDYDEQQIKK